MTNLEQSPTDSIERRLSRSLALEYAVRTTAKAKSEGSEGAEVRMNQNKDDVKYNLRLEAKELANTRT